MTDEAKSILNDEDKALIEQFKKEQIAWLRSIKSTESTLGVLLQAIAATPAAKQYWLMEAEKHMKYFVLTLSNAMALEANIAIVKELRKRKAAMDAEAEQAKAIADFNSQLEPKDEAVVDGKATT